MRGHVHRTAHIKSCLREIGVAVRHRDADHRRQVRFGHPAAAAVEKAADVHRRKADNGRNIPVPHLRHHAYVRLRLSVQHAALRDACCPLRRRRAAGLDEQVNAVGRREVHGTGRVHAAIGAALAARAGFEPAVAVVGLAAWICRARSCGIGEIRVPGADVGPVRDVALRHLPIRRPSCFGPGERQAENKEPRWRKPLHSEVPARRGAQSSGVPGPLFAVCTRAARRRGAPRPRPRHTG